MYKSKKGMTLIEIIVYIGLLSTVMMIAGISFSYIRNKTEEVSVQEEITKVKNFLNKEILDSSKSTKIKKINLAENKILETKSEKSINLMHLTVDVKNLQSTSFEIYEGRFANSNFSIKLIDKNKGGYIIAICKDCEKIHY